MVNQKNIRNIIESTIFDVIAESTNKHLYKKRTIDEINKFFDNADWLYEDWPEDNPNHLPVNEYLEQKFRDDFFHGKVHQTVMRLEPIIMRIALELGYEQDEEDTEKLSRLERIVNYIASAVNNAVANKQKPPFDLSKMTSENTTFKSLEKMFGTMIDNRQREEDELLSKSKFDGGMNKDYQILSNVDFETAHKLEPYTCSSSVLCFTKKESTWEKYTNKGNNVAYVLLRKGWENEPEEHGKYTPYDDYGLSMIFLFVDGDGNIAYSTTRWNHQTGGVYANVDHAFTKEYISKLLNVNFNSVFRGNDKFKNNVRDAIERLKQGESIHLVFSDVKPVLRDSQNRYMYKAKLDEHYNVIDKNGNLLFPNMWFNKLSDFDNNGLAWCKRNEKENYCTADGRILSEDMWFDNVWEFKNGFAWVEVNHVYNYIDKDGNLLSPKQWFSSTSDFNENGFAKVSIGRNEFIIDKNGRIRNENGTQD